MIQDPRQKQLCGEEKKKKEKKNPAPHTSADPESLLERQKAPGSHSENADTGSSNLGELIPPHGY